MRVRYDDLLNKVTDLFISKGFKKEDAFIIADCFTAADLNGVFTHGTKLIPTYLKKINEGSFNIKGDIEIINSTEALTVVDGNNLLGSVSAAKCMDIAVAKAKKQGMHTVFCRNANTLGPAFYYTEKAAEKGCLGFVTTNSPAAMAVWNGSEKMLGTNPLSASVPNSEEPVIMDMATSVVAKSRFKSKMMANEELPDGWATDIDGNPTNDPEEGIRGLVMPMAGFKGYSLALMIDIFSGFLSGSGYLNEVGGFYLKDDISMNVGAMFIAFDPSIIYGDNYINDIDDYFSKIRNSKSKEGFDIALPNDNRIVSKKDALENGIEFNDQIIEELNKLLVESDIESFN